MMSVSDALKNRRSARAFKKQDVPQEVIREVIDLARLAPSNSNTQPWHIAIVSGAARQNLEAHIFAQMAAGVQPHPFFPPGGKGLHGVHKDRQYECAYHYYDALGIGREDAPARKEVALLNWRFFGAPHVAFISMPQTMHRANAIDLGIFLQSILLLFEERGIASIPQGALAAFPDAVRAFAPIPQENAILCGISFGYRDEAEAINNLKQPRAALEDIASFTE